MLICQKVAFSMLLSIVDEVVDDEVKVAGFRFFVFQKKICIILKTAEHIFGPFSVTKRNSFSLFLLVLKLL